MRAIDMDLLDEIGNAVMRGEREWPAEYTRKHVRWMPSTTDPDWTLADAFLDADDRNRSNDTSTVRRVVELATGAQVALITNLLTRVPEAIAAAHTPDFTKLSKRDATKLIDRLKLDAKAPAPSPAAVNFLRALMADRDVAAELVAATEKALNESALTAKDASSLINMFKTLPMRPIAVSTHTGGTGNAARDRWNELAAPIAALGSRGLARFAVDTEDGATNELAFWAIKKHGDRYYLRQVIGGSGMVRVSLGYPAMIAIAQKAHDAGIMEAMARYGQEIGSCCRCGTELTNDESRDRGIGPECIKKF